MSVKLVGMYEYLNMVVIYISLITSDVEYFYLFIGNLYIIFCKVSV